MPHPRAFFIGDSNSRDFADQVAFLKRLCDVEFADDISTACQRLCADPTDVLVVAVGWPGERSDDEFEWLRRAAPFTPIVRLLSAWCEGEERTGKPWPGAVRLYAHQFIARLTAQLTIELLDSGQQFFDLWSPPFTKTHEDRLLANGRQYRSSRRITVAIHAKSRVSAGSLVDALASAGIMPELLMPDTPAREGDFDAILWDCTASLASEAAAVKDCRAHGGETPLVVLLNFPRPADYDLASDLGVAAIVSKPFLLEDLVSSLRRVTDIKQITQGAGGVAG